METSEQSSEVADVSVIGVALSKNKVAVRLTTERWMHVVESHDYMAGFSHEVLEAVNDPDYIVKGRREELLAVRFLEETVLGPKYLVVVYRETNKRGFVITAFMTSKIERLIRREVLWRRH